MYYLPNLNSRSCDKLYSFWKYILPSINRQSMTFLTFVAIVCEVHFASLFLIKMVILLFETTTIVCMPSLIVLNYSHLSMHLELRQIERPHFALHAPARRLYPSQTNPSRIYQKWIHQPRQAFQPFVSRSSVLDQKYSPCRQDGSLRYSGSQGHWVSHSVYPEGNQIGQESAECRKGVRGCNEAAWSFRGKEKTFTGQLEY